MGDRLRQGLLVGLIVVSIGVAAMGLLGRDAESGDRAYALEQQLRCPVCKTVSIAESPSETAASMRRITERQVAEGRTDAEIIDYFQDRYGEWVLLNPPREGRTLPLWLLPVVGLGFAAALVLRQVRFGTSSADPAELDDDDLALVEAAKNQRLAQLSDHGAEDEGP